MVLVVEDDQATRSFLLENLIADGFRAAVASGVHPSLVAFALRAAEGRPV
jgi:DNA-binding response OmpR family regulator